MSVHCSTHMTSMGSCTKYICMYYVCMQPIREKNAIDPDHVMMAFPLFFLGSRPLYKVCTKFISEGRLFSYFSTLSHISG